MVSSNGGCNGGRLSRLLQDRLSGPEQEEVAAHVETCEACQLQLESLAADVNWWSDVRELLGSDVGGTRVRPGAENNQEATEQRTRLDFLQPSKDPNALGCIGPYAILEVVSHGGMGIVLKGWDEQLKRHVAIKVLAPHFAASAAARRRFAREAEAAAAVVHPHVVAIHAVDHHRPYLVMPYVSGQSLEQRVRQHGPLEVKETLRIAMQIAHGLAAAHAQGLVHRDIKPSNILLENGVQRVMITDFGLARAADDASLTHSGILAGTPQYMSPEQANGETVDHRTDLFSLGSVIYTMCAGRPPFRAQTTMGVLRRICESPPRPLREVNPDIPDWLAEIVEKLHAKRPGERFQSAAEVAELLGQYLAHLQQPTVVPMPARVRSVWNRHPRTGKAMVAAAMLLVAMIGLYRFGMVDLFPSPEVDQQQATPPPAAAEEASPRIVFYDSALLEFRAPQIEQDLQQIETDLRALETVIGPNQVP